MLAAVLLLILLVLELCILVGIDDAAGLLLGTIVQLETVCASGVVIVAIGCFDERESAMDRLGSAPFTIDSESSTCIDLFSISAGEPNLRIVSSVDEQFWIGLITCGFTSTTREARPLLLTCHSVSLGI